MCVCVYTSIAVEGLERSLSEHERGFRISPKTGMKLIHVTGLGGDHRKWYRWKMLEVYITVWSKPCKRNLLDITVRMPSMVVLAQNYQSS